MTPSSLSRFIDDRHWRESRRTLAACTRLYNKGWIRHGMRSWEGRDSLGTSFLSTYDIAILWLGRLAERLTASSDAPSAGNSEQR